MKKVFAILAIAVGMAACNNKSEKKADAAVDTAAKITDDLTKMMDIVAKKMEEAKPKM